MWSGISDCDETFNYWEPLHYLIYGKGFQTWEYDPQYGLRSYFYILLHTGVASYTLKTFSFQFFYKQNKREKKNLKTSNPFESTNLCEKMPL